MSKGLTRVRVLATIEAIVVLAAVIAMQYALAGSSRKPAMRDFRVVYCGERAVLHRADPYLAEPLRSCENAVAPSDGDAPWMVTPFPLPGYAGAMLLPIGALPFNVASFAWLGALTLAFGLTAMVLAEIVGSRAWPVALVLAPTLGILNQYYGEPVDIAIAAFCIAALCLVHDRPRYAGLAAAIGMLEPHVGLPACVGLFVLVPRARTTLVALGLTLAIVSIAALGPHTNLEYLTGFLPLQAHAELYAADQYSLTRLLFLAGAAPHVAIVLGSLSYVLMVAVGVFAAWRLAALGLSRSLIVLLPVATAMFAGSFVHDVEIASALPAAIVLAPFSATARIAVSLLAMQWGFTVRGIIGLAITATIGLVAFALPHATLVRRIAYGACVVVAIAILDAAVIPLVHDRALRGVPGVAFEPNMLSSIPWEWSIRLTPVSIDFDPRQLFLKLPTWIALAAIPLSVLEIGARKKYAAKVAQGIETAT